MKLEFIILIKKEDKILKQNNAELIQKNNYAINCL